MSTLTKVSTAIAASSVVVWACVSYAAQNQTCELRERHKVQASDGSESANFGSVALDGDYACIGAWRDEHAGYQSGSAYIFRHDDNGTPADPHDDSWLEQAKLTASDADVNDQFGADTAISGDWAVVGAMRNDDFGESSGAAYMFYRDDNGTPLDPTDDTWVEHTKLFPADGAEDDHFGDTVAISGNRVLIGAPYQDLGSRYDYNGGAAYVYKLHYHGVPNDPSDDLWLLETKLTRQSSQEYSMFGIGLDIDGDLAVVGSFKDDIAETDAGAATVFYLRDNIWWVRQTMLTASDAAEYDRFGLSVGVSGSWIAAGAHRDDDYGDDAGSVYLFRCDDNGTPNDRADDTWIEHGKLWAPDAEPGDWFGYKVSIDGDWLTVSSANDGQGGLGILERRGAVYVFLRDDGGTPDDLTDDVWNQHDKLRSSDLVPGDQFGAAVLSGQRVLVGARYDDGPDEYNMGSAYIFELGRQCVTLQEFAALQNCYSDDNVTPDCEAFDFDDDGDVDNGDYDEFMVTFSGP